MAADRFTIHGRIHVNGDGVHGLTVDASDRDLFFYEPMGSALTSRNGEFVFEFRQTGLERLFDAEPEVVLTVRDVLGNKLATIDEGAVCRRGERFDFDLGLKPADVAAHLDHAKSLDESGGWPPASKMLAVASAWNELAASRGDARTFRDSFALCPAPPILRFPDLIDVAFGVLEGQIEAIGRFRDILTTVTAAMPPDIERERRIDALAGEGNIDSADYWSARLDEMAKVRRQLPAAGDPVLPESSFPAVIAAAALMGGGDPKAIHRNVSLVLGQLCGLERMSPVFRAADLVRRNIDGGLAQFARAWTDFTGICGPDDGPIPPIPGTDPHPFPLGPICPDAWPPVPGGFPRDPGVIEKWECTAQTVLAIRRHGLGTPYSIASVSNLRACPGETLTITGVGFGSTPGEVQFSPPGSAPVTPTSWSDTSITVVVPPHATCGPLTLKIFHATIRACGRFIDLYKYTVGVFEFRGGRTRVSSLRFRDGRTSRCANPGSAVRLEWSTCNADTARVVVRRGNGSELFRIDPAALSGSRTINLPNVTVSEQITATVQVTGPCGTANETATLTIETPYNLSIDGMEVTQAIQYYRASEHLTGSEESDNSLRLVTNKAAVVRVYLRSGGDLGFAAGRLTGVTGTLTVERRVGGIWSTIATLAPVNGPVAAEASYPNYAAERGNLNSSLNFGVPANLMQGLLRFRADVSSPDSCDSQSAAAEVEVDVNLTQTLNAAFVRVAYNGPNGTRTGNLNLPAPSLATCQAETAWAMAAYPLSGAANVRIAATITTNTPLDDARTAPGACSANWGPLLTAIAASVAADAPAATASGVSWVYYGIIANGIPVTVPGCNGGATGGVAGLPATYAHEIGHQFGLQHAPAGNVGTVNDEYPLYAPYDTPDPPGTTNFNMASIGEYGLDTRFPYTLYSPVTSEDIMSYGGPRWVSLYTHNFLINPPILVPQAVPTGAATDGGSGGSGAPAEESDFDADDRAVRPRVYVLGWVDAGGKVEVERVARLETRYLVRDGRQQRLRLQLLGTDAEVIADDSLFAFSLHGGCGCRDDCADDGSGYRFAAMVNDLAPGSAMQIVDPASKEVVWRREAPSRPAVVTGVTAEIKQDILKLTWKPDFDDAAVTDIWARWSADDGETWHGLSVGLAGGAAELDISHLPGGTLKFQLQVQDGFHSTVAESNDAGHESPPPSVVIVSPVAGRKPGQQFARMHLSGFAAGEGIDALSDEDYRWTIDGKEVGTGRDIWVETPPAGTREIELQVRSGAGTGSSRVEVEV